MDRFRIEGGNRLQGTVRISGAKNSALPAMAAALLTSEPVHLQNIPRVRDIITMARLLAHMNALRGNARRAAYRSDDSGARTFRMPKRRTNWCAPCARRF